MSEMESAELADRMRTDDHEWAKFLIKQWQASCNVLIDYVYGCCACDTLRDPKDPSRFAGYKKHSGYCSACKALDKAADILDVERQG